jgi:ribose 5-phosphate isomerase B
MKIAIGSDHAGFELKQYLVRELKTLGHEIIDCGTDSEQAVDYPDYAAIVCGHVRSGEARYGILICGTGIGISMAANKLPGIRAALCHTEFSARLARLHNDANVLALGGRVIGKALALEITKVFLATEFSAEERHRRRIGKMMSLGENSGD